MLLETNKDLTNFLNEDEYLKPEMRKMNIAIAREEERNRMISKIDKLEDKLVLKNKEIKKLLQDKNAYINITNEALRDLKHFIMAQDEETAVIVIERLFNKLSNLNSKHKNDTNTASYMEKVKLINNLKACIRMENTRSKELKTLLEQKEEELHEKQVELHYKRDVITISNAIIKNQKDKIKSLQNTQNIEEDLKQEIMYLNEEVKAKDKIIDKQVKSITELVERNNASITIINGLMSL